MNGNAELLNYIYQNAQMGVETIGQLLELVGRSEFRRHMEYEHKHYREMRDAARQMLEENGYDEKGLSALTKIKAYLGINLQTLTDQSTSHIAEMMILGSNMGIIDAIKNIRKYHEAEKDILTLLEHLLQFEEDNVEALKAFL